MLKFLPCFLVFASILLFLTQFLVLSLIVHHHNGCCSFSLPWTFFLSVWWWSGAFLVVVSMEYSVLQFSSDTLFPFPPPLFFPPSFLFTLHGGFPTDITGLNYVAKDKGLDFTVFREAFLFAVVFMFGSCKLPLWKQLAHMLIIRHERGSRLAALPSRRAWQVPCETKAERYTFLVCCSYKLALKRLGELPFSAQGRTEYITTLSDGCLPRYIHLLLQILTVFCRKEKC